MINKTPASFIFDTHTHYNDAAFDEDRDLLLSSLPDKGVCGIIECATTLDDSNQCISLAQKYPYIYSAVGIHPESIGNPPVNWLSCLSKLASSDKVVAVGEIGLDYYWEDNPPKEIQIKIFEEQIKLACSLNLPIIVHDRDAHKDTLELLKKYTPHGVVHCFSGSVEMSREIIKLGMYIGIGGVVTFKNAKHSLEVAKDIPLDRLLLETDAPYMAPIPFRGNRNDSSLIMYVAETIATLRGITTDELLYQTMINAKKLFRI